jgi:ferredoxin
MKVTVDRTLCSGHARCFALHPEVFDIDDLGYVVVDEVNAVPSALEEAARSGAAACPERAISLV